VTPPRSSALLLAAALLAACDEAPSFTHYILALSWQPAFCESHRDKPECRALDGGDYAAHRLALHGLWPNDNAGESPSYCGSWFTTKSDDRPAQWCELPEPELSAETRESLARIMPGTASCLDRHEWAKHGTCAGIGDQAYFDGMLQLAAAVQATPLGQLIAGHVGRDLQRRQLIDAFEAAFGPGSGRALGLLCAPGGGYTNLSEIRIALKPTALDGALDRDDLYLEGPAPRGTCPAIVHIDPVGP
jgi:ribonuclease T2